jgi:hypothetical protein
MHAVLNGGGCFPSPTTFTLTAGALAGFAVAAECGAATVTEGPRSYQVYNLRVTASRGAIGAEDYFSRTLISSVADRS